jgi:hypothetical protein
LVTQVQRKHTSVRCYARYDNLFSYKYASQKSGRRVHLLWGSLFGSRHEYVQRNCSASKSIHDVVAQRIPVLLSRPEHRNSGSVVWWEVVEEHAVRSWITARTHQPQYIIARSVLISSVGFLVTICVVFCLGFSIWGWIKVKRNRNPGGRRI